MELQTRLHLSSQAESPLISGWRIKKKKCLKKNKKTTRSFSNLHVFVRRWRAWVARPSGSPLLSARSCLSAPQSFGMKSILWGQRGKAQVRRRLRGTGRRSGERNTWQMDFKSKLLAMILIYLFYFFSFFSVFLQSSRSLEVSIHWSFISCYTPQRCRILDSDWPATRRVVPNREANRRVVQMRLSLSFP